MSATPRFRLARRKLAPPWVVREGDGELIGYALDIIKDAFIERLRLGLLARLPQQDPDGTPAPSDALAAIGHDRRVVRGINETETAYAKRLIAWLDDRKTAGNPFALMQKLAEYTGPLPSFRTVDARGNWYSRAANGTRSMLLKQGNWDWDGIDPLVQWSKFWVIIYPNGLWSESAYDWGDAAGPDWGESAQTIGSTATPEEVEAIRFLVSDWKPAGTKCINIIVAFDPASFDPTHALHGAGLPDGLWEHWSKVVGGVQVPARLATARYWDGV